MYRWHPVLFVLLLPVVANGQPLGLETISGIYDSGRSTWVVGKGDSLYIEDAKTGAFRELRQIQPNLYAYGPTYTTTAPQRGTVRFTRVEPAA